jgi:hypothetical protein
MFFLATAVALSFLGPLVNAQTSDTGLGLAAIEAHFKNADLVPSLLSTFSPTAVMNLTFPNVGAISPGQNLTMQREPSQPDYPCQKQKNNRLSEMFFFFAEVAPTPEITVIPGPGSSSSSFTGNFTLVMADADVVGTNESVGQTRHWLVNGVTLKSVYSPPSLSR